MSQSVENRYMEFRLGEQLFSVPLLTVKEVISRPEITSIPNMPSHFEGMFNLRGQILGVVNIRKKLAVKGSSQDSGADGKVVIVIEHAGINVGMIVDEVTRVLHADPDKISPAPLKDDDPAHQFVDSVIQAGEHLVPTIKVARLLELDRYKNQGKEAA